MEMSLVKYDCEMNLSWEKEWGESQLGELNRLGLEFWLE
jgi:hypothetical protein